jgi:hypothetical protein
MYDNLSTILLLGAIALCTIIGIYYCWVRKLNQADKSIEASQPANPR